MAILKFNEDIMTCKMKSDTGVAVTGEYGTQYKWECNADDIFYATEQFNTLLKASGVKEGDVLSIRKRKKEDIQGKVFMVFEVNGKTIDDFNGVTLPTTPQAPSPATSPTSDKVAQLEKRVKALEDKLGTPSVSEEDIPF